MTGRTVTLTVKTKSGADPFGNDIYTESQVEVENVLIGEPSADDIVTSQSLYGKQVVFTLGIPKGDTHVWTDTKVSFFGETFETIGYPAEGQEELIPGPWHKKVKVGRYG